MRVNAQDVARSVVREGDVIDIGAYRLGILDRDPPGLVEKDFLDAIARARTTTLRAVYGDWLEESGRLGDAAFLRAQIEVRRLASDNALPRAVRDDRELAPRDARTRGAAPSPAGDRELQLRARVQFEVQCQDDADRTSRAHRAARRALVQELQRACVSSTIPAARRFAIAGQCVPSICGPALRRRPQAPAQSRCGAMLPPLLAGRCLPLLTGYPSRERRTGGYERVRWRARVRSSRHGCGLRSAPSIQHPAAGGGR